MALSEQRARSVARDLLSFRGWDIRPISSGGQLLEEAEYRAFPKLTRLFDNESKTGPGFGKPDFLLVDSPDSLKPLIVIDTKAQSRDIKKSILDTNHYGDAILRGGREALSVAIAGAAREICEVRVQRNVSGNWHDLTLHNRAIDWIPSPEQTTKLLSISGRVEVSPERPPDRILAEQAGRMNEILRTCKIKDEFRPIYAATFMLALWYGSVSADPDVVLEQINSNAAKALKRAGKPDLANSLRVDTENEDLALNAWEIIDILTTLNIRSFITEHDYLGQLYETFFRYTGGNTIGQYFTPRHIIDMICDVVDVQPDDTVFDPACGTGGFLIGAIRKMIDKQKLGYEDAMTKIKDNVFGIESEPSTAALCIANMILRGDGKSGIIRANCFTKHAFPAEQVDIALLNPPFPHKKEDIPPTRFIDRAAESVRHKGLVASVVPYSLLVKTTDWHRSILKKNRLLFIATLPADAFQPYASFNTAVVVFQKGVPHGNNKVFFARIANDGFKLKKNNRLPQPGSQIPLILAAYEEKKCIPEMSAFSEIDLNSKEWSPEAYIASAPHSNSLFTAGLEQSVRNQASFLIANGHRLLGADFLQESTVRLSAFSSRTKVDLSKVSFKLFRIADFFDFKLGGKDEIEDLTEGGPTPIVSTSEFDNGITTWRHAETIYRPPVITVATDGSTCSSFVQEYPFYAFYKVALLWPKKGIECPIAALYFIAFQLSMERWRYVYARKFGKGRIGTTAIYLPEKGGLPDFCKMGEIVETCSAYALILSFREVYEQHVTNRFQQLVAIWRAERKSSGTIARLIDHPAYREIVDMGEIVLPHILSDLRKTKDHWFIALYELTRAEPVLGHERGDVGKMAEAWLRWGEERGINSYVKH